MRTLLIMSFVLGCFQTQTLTKNEKKMITGSIKILTILKEKKDIQSYYINDYFLKSDPQYYTDNKIEKSIEILNLFVMPEKDKIEIEHINNKEATIVKFIFDKKSNSSEEFKDINNASISFTFIDKASTDKIVDFDYEFNSESEIPHKILE